MLSIMIKRGRLDYMHLFYLFLKYSIMCTIHTLYCSYYFSLQNIMNHNIMTILEILQLFSQILKIVFENLYSVVNPHLLLLNAMSWVTDEASSHYNNFKQSAWVNGFISKFRPVLRKWKIHHQHIQKNKPAWLSCFPLIIFKVDRWKPH